jgi:hypothetical protein
MTQIEIRFHQPIEVVGTNWRPRGSIVLFPHKHAIRPDPFTLRLDNVELCEVRTSVVLLRWQRQVRSCSLEHIQDITIDF